MFLYGQYLALTYSGLGKLGVLMTPSFEIIRIAREEAAKGKLGFQPTKHFERKDLDLSTMKELTNCHVNSAHTYEIKGLIADRWIMWLMQTEMTVNGHVMMAYFAR